MDSGREWSDTVRQGVLQVRAGYRRVQTDGATYNMQRPSERRTYQCTGKRATLVEIQTSHLPGGEKSQVLEILSNIPELCGQLKTYVDVSGTCMALRNAALARL